MDILKGKTALVTGSSSGIGEAIAMLFGKEGANVIVTYNSGKDRGEAVAQKINALGVNAKAYQLNAADEENVKQVFAEINKEFGDLTILVNNAGINGDGTYIEDMSTDKWDKVIKTNLYGPFFCTREFLQMKKKYGTYKGSRVINVTSIHQYVNVRGTANYNASKSAMRNFAYTLALEMADRELTVNNIAPGMILTPINQKVIDDPEKLKRAENIIPFHRGGQPSEVANVALFLASDASSYVTGSTYTVDGALSILGPDA